MTAGPGVGARLGAWLVRYRYGRLLAIGGAVLCADQLSKAAVAAWLAPYQRIVLIDGLLALNHVRNPGGAFGFLAGQGATVRTLVFIVFSLAAVGMIFWFYHQAARSQPALTGALALVLGGAVGNLTDRLRLGQVIDFIDVHLGGHHWPTFNLADSAISVGIGLYLLAVVRSRRTTGG